MRKVIQLAVLASTVITSVHAKPLVVYGEDNRSEVYEATAAHQLLANSTAAMISKRKISREKDRPGVASLEQMTLREWMETPDEDADSEQQVTFCEETRFTEQPRPASCSGFLIAPDLVVTAGHCAAIANSCEDYQWVFDFNLDKKTQTAGTEIKEENIYKCEKVVSNMLLTTFGMDYAVIKLDRKVKGRTPLQIRSEKTIADASKVLVIGNPSGLPTKVTTDGSVRRNNHPNFFVTNLDTFQGNSGSAVFNAQSGVVEGILVRGENDYIYDEVKMCMKVNECAEGACRGEDVSRMTSIPEVAAQNALYAAATSGDLVQLMTILSRRVWIDFNTADGQSALIKASGAGQAKAMKMLIDKGANIEHSDAKGNTSLHELALGLNAETTDALNLLVEAGAKIEAKNDLGQTPLLAAGSWVNLEAVKLLIKAGADKNAVDAKGENVLFSFLRADKLSAVAELSQMGVDLKPVLAIASKKQKLKLKLMKMVNI